MSKPYKGEIHNWRLFKHITGETSIIGLPIGHPKFINWIRTSPIVSKNGDMVETKNSLYKLVGEECK